MFTKISRYEKCKGQNICKNIKITNFFQSKTTKDQIVVDLMEKVYQYVKNIVSYRIIKPTGRTIYTVSI